MTELCQEFFGPVYGIQRSEILSNEVGEVLQKEEAVTDLLLLISPCLILCHLSVCALHCCSTWMIHGDSSSHFPSEGGSCPNDGPLGKGF